MASVQGDLLRHDAGNAVARTLARERFDLLFKWEVEDGDDYDHDHVPCSAFGAMDRGWSRRVRTQNHWWTK
jgi:hypothetical protein